MNKMFKYLTLTFILSILFICVACGQKDNAVKVGVILPLTGTLAQMGEVERNAMIMAADKVNSGQKILELIFHDGKGNPSEAVTIANRLLDIDQVDIMITSTTGASLAVEPIMTGKKKNLISFCMDPDISKKSPFVLRFYEGMNEEVDAINKYFASAQSLSKIGILYANVTAFEKVVTQSYVPYLKQNNVAIPVIERYALTDKDFRSQILKMKKANIDHLLILGYGFEYDNIFKQLVENGLYGKVKIIGGWGFLYTSVDRNLLEGVLVAGPEYVFQKQQISDFQKEYIKRFNKYPNFDAAFAYNMIIELGELIKANKIDIKQPLKNNLIKRGELTGVVGKYHFSSDGEMIVKTGLGIYRNGTIIHNN